MKTIGCVCLLLMLIGCGKQPFQSGTAEFVHIRTGPSTSTVLTGENYKGEVSATETFKYRNPQVALYDAYIVVSYPGTDMKDRVVPRDSLIELRWKK